MLCRSFSNRRVERNLLVCYRQVVNFASTPSTASSEVLTDEDKVLEEDPKLAELRDISRMRPWHRSILHGQPPSIDTFKWQKERWALKERYAAYGRASGVDPGVHWPTSEELKEIQEEEDELEVKLLPMMEETRKLQAQRQLEVEQRYADLDKKAKEYPKVLEAYRKRLREEQAAIDEEERMKDEKIKEIQSYFGFAIEVTDPRFTAMIAKKELEEKQAKRKQQKKEKELEALRQLEEETKLLKQREQLQFQGKKTETPPVQENPVDAKAKAA